MDKFDFMWYNTKYSAFQTAVRRKDVNQMDYIEKRFCYTVPTDLNMYYCGKRIHTRDHSYGPQVRDHFLLVYVKDGDAILSVRNRHYALTSGHLLCMFPDEKIYYKAKKGSLWSNLWVGVYGNQAAFYVQNLGITRDYPIYRCPQPDETERCMDDLICFADCKNTYGKINVIATLYQFFRSLYSKSAEPLSDMPPIYDIHQADTHEITYLSDNIYIREAENIIRFHYDRDINVRSLAQSFHLTLEYFSRLFKAETGKNPHQMIMDYRMEKARALLTTTNLTVAEIANCVGIRDAHYFSKLFKSVNGCTPTEYRKVR